MMSYMEVDCSNCCKKINKQLWQIKKFKNLFCSKECKCVFYTKKVSIICQICGKQFFRTPKTIEKNQTSSCSPECSAKSISKMFSMTRTCKICGEEFTFPKSRAKYFKKEY